MLPNNNLNKKRRKVNVRSDYIRLDFIDLLYFMSL